MRLCFIVSSYLDLFTFLKIVSNDRISLIVSLNDMPLHAKAIYVKK